jgi:transketolase
MALPPYAPWRRLVDGRGWVVLVTGPLAGGIWDAVRQLDGDQRPTLWLLTELPPEEIPDAFLDDITRSRRLLVVEEHVAQGGLASIIARLLLERGRSPERFVTRSAQGYPSGRYGSQKFHRRECGLDAAAIVEFLTAEHAKHV